MPMSRPLGESGAFFASLSPGNSFLRLFAIESSHLPAQLRQAGGQDKVISQDIRLKVMVLPGGAPVAVAGSARTEHRTADGRHAAMEELAYVSHFRRFVTSAANLAAGAGSQTMPQFTYTSGSFLSAVQVLNDRRVLGTLYRQPLAGLLHSLSPDALRTAAAALERMASALGGLPGLFAGLADESTFTAAETRSSTPLFVAARATRTSAAGNYRVEVLSAARGHEVRSTGEPAAPLGLTGSFTVNGVAVSVAATDALSDLALRINRGEDANGNGALDAGEDLDGNRRLDGGTDAHGVVASFYGGRLTLRAASPAAGRLALSDGDGILQAIGLLRRDSWNDLVFADEVHAPTEAVIRVNGRELRSADGHFDEAAPGLSLDIFGQPEAAVTVSVASGPSPAMEALRTAVDAFNGALGTINVLLGGRGGILAGDPAATRVRAEPVAGQPAGLDRAAKAGLDRAASSRVVFAEESLAAAARSAGGPLAAWRSPPGVQNALLSLGITMADDDTLLLDEERFAAVLDERPEEVAGLFARAEEGIAARVVRRLDDALGRNGLLELRRQALEWLAAQGDTREFARAMEAARHSASAYRVLLPTG
jgi:flagellar capping protein FliD